MAEQITQQNPEESKGKIIPIQKESEKIVRILSKDIEGGMTIYAGFTKIKGISWSLSNAICKNLNLDKKRKIGSLTEEEIKKINNSVKKISLPKYLMNRRGDFTTGEDVHLVGSDLELRTEFDIKRLKKVKTYRGLRHASGQPSRGQRTKGHFRTNRRKGVGIKKKVKKDEKKT